MRAAFRIFEDKISLKNYLTIADFLSLSDMISMFCLDKTGSYFSLQKNLQIFPSQNGYKISIPLLSQGNDQLLKKYNLNFEFSLKCIV
jgi:hypothetical protein